MNYVRALWCMSQNFGDALNPWLIGKLSGKAVAYVDQNEQSLKYVVCGSILNWCDERCIAWGPGVANDNDNIRPGVDIRAVRGPLTKACAERSSLVCPDVFGDPALLIPEVYTPRSMSNVFEVGVIPHYVDQEEVLRTLPVGFKYINVFDHVEQVIDDVYSCKTIVSSSLHGLIVAHAFGKPAMWMKVTNKILGDGTKFRDHLLAVMANVYEPIPFGDIAKLSPKDVMNRAKPYVPGKFDTRRLMAACPFV